MQWLATYIQFTWNIKTYSKRLKLKPILNLKALVNIVTRVWLYLLIHNLLFCSYALSYLKRCVRPFRQRRDLRCFWWRNLHWPFTWHMRQWQQKHKERQYVVPFLDNSRYYLRIVTRHEHIRCDILKKSPIKTRAHWICFKIIWIFGMKAA